MNNRALQFDNNYCTQCDLQDYAENGGEISNNLKWDKRLTASNKLNNEFMVSLPMHF